MLCSQRNKSDQGLDISCAESKHRRRGTMKVGSGPGTYGRGQHKQSVWFKRMQVLLPLLPIPMGCYLLYNALTSMNRSPPPISSDPKTVLSRKLYAEPVYQRVSFAPSTIARNMSPRGGGE